ncbi:hypothetical protein [Chryseosolibacter indicus]|uniref:DUF4397 domain-containing protein n=1 Tax=Chryseosolibacter indicus TaxID=2782351 RepID=A0ABS5VNR8_9BACT|nr:hypothetical protein [Chryseosolibacter indicus]MBT1703089.1 hypothetical protein [Chryseosolibacter indicus]
MNLSSLFCVGFLAVLFMSCSTDDKDEQLRIFSYSFDFNNSDHGWKAGFAEYSADPADTAAYELKFQHTIQPLGVNRGIKALMLSGNNQGGDLFMYLKKQISDLEPNTSYYVTIEVELASDANNGQVTGTGEVAAEKIYLKVGATQTEPISVVENNYYKINIDKADQNQSGTDMVFIGDISLPKESPTYTIINQSNSPYNKYYNAPIIITSDKHGAVWLIVGTDSNFKGKTSVYYTKISAVFSLTKK